MNEEYIRELLQAVEKGETTGEEAFERLKTLPYSDLGFANIDHHRAIRTGFPEVIFCQGKTPEQIRDIFLELMGHGQNVMATRATKKDHDAVRSAIPRAIYHETARIISFVGDGSSQGALGPDDETNRGEYDGSPRNESHNAGTSAEKENDKSAYGTVAVVSAGTADIPVAEEAAVTAEILGNRVTRVYDVGVAGIHRLFDRLEEIRRADVVIVVAGMEGALASVLGGLVDSPVIAVPTSVGYGANLGGLSALLSMLNSCANGVSVVNIDNGFGAAYMASVINRKISLAAEAASIETGERK